MNIHRIGTDFNAVVSTKTYTPAINASHEIERLLPGIKGEQYVLLMNGGTYVPLWLLERIILNLTYGGWGVPNAEIGVEGFLAAPLVANVSQSLTVQKNLGLFAVGTLLLILNDYPAIHAPVTEMEPVLVTGYTGENATIQGFGTGGAVKYNHPEGAIVQPLCAFPSSVGLNGVPGVRTQEEQPGKVTGLTVGGDTSGVDVSWDTHPNWMSSVSRGCVQFYDVFVLKHGQGITQRGPASGVKITMLPSGKDVTPVSSNDLQTVTVTTYYDQTVNALQALTSGTFYVYVYPKMGTLKTPESGFGSPAIKEITL